MVDRQKGGGRLLTMWAGAQAASQAQHPWQETSTPTSPRQDKPPPLPERLLQPKEPRWGSRRRESPLYPARGAGGGGRGREVVAGVGGDENSVGEKKNLPWMEIRKRSWELDGKRRGGYQEGVFLLFSSYG